MGIIDEIINNNMECEHDWVKITKIQKQRVWFMIFIYCNEVEHKEKYVCLNCGKERR